MPRLTSSSTNSAQTREPNSTVAPQRHRRKPPCTVGCTVAPPRARRSTPGFRLFGDDAHPIEHRVFVGLTDLEAHVAVLHVDDEVAHEVGLGARRDHVIEEELPSEERARFWPFLAGAVSYTVLLLTIEAIWMKTV